MSTERPPPAEKASAIINSVPQSSLLSKTGTIVLGTGLTAAAISSEIYVMNEEAVILAGFVILASYIGKVRYEKANSFCFVGSLLDCFFLSSSQSIREPYKNWAEGHITRIKGVLNGARSAHTDAVKERIGAVSEMRDVVPLTQSLFALARETAELESGVFVQRQRTALAAELRSVLDSWVRYEQQQKESEQAQLAKTVIDSVMKNIHVEKTQRDILAAAVAEVERESMCFFFLCCVKFCFSNLLSRLVRIGQGEGYLNP